MMSMRLPLMMPLPFLSVVMMIARTFIMTKLTMAMLIVGASATTRRMGRGGGAVGHRGRAPRVGRRRRRRRRRRRGRRREGDPEPIHLGDVPLVEAGGAIIPRGGGVEAQVRIARAGSSPSHDAAGNGGGGGGGGMGGTRCSAGDAIAAGGARGSPTLLVAAEDPAQHASLCILLDHRGVDEGVMMGWSMREGGKKQRDVHQASFSCYGSDIYDIVC
jgi:hypothetical protein